MALLSLKGLQFSLPSPMVGTIPLKWATVILRVRGFLGIEVQDTDLLFYCLVNFFTAVNNGVYTKLYLNKVEGKFICKER